MSPGNNNNNNNNKTAPDDDNKMRKKRRGKSGGIEITFAAVTRRPRHARRSRVYSIRLYFGPILTLKSRPLENTLFFQSGIEGYDSPPAGVAPYGRRSFGLARRSPLPLSLPLSLSFPCRFELAIEARTRHARRLKGVLPGRHSWKVRSW